MIQSEIILYTPHAHVKRDVQIATLFSVVVWFGLIHYSAFSSAKDM